MPHRIRLGPPWEVTESAGFSRHVRKFGRPRTLDSAEQIWLVCDSLPAGSEVSVNGTSIGTATGGPFAGEITPLMNPRNVLTVAVPAGAAIGDVALEIRTPETA